MRLARAGQSVRLLPLVVITLVLLSTGALYVKQMHGPRRRGSPSSVPDAHARVSPEDTAAVDVFGAPH